MSKAEAILKIDPENELRFRGNYCLILSPVFSLLVSELIYMMSLKMILDLLVGWWVVVFLPLYSWRDVEETTSVTG